MSRAARAADVDAGGFGARLRAFRRARGLRQQDLAEGEYSAAYISMLESGRTRASMKALEHIAKKLGVSVAELMGGAPQASEAEARLAVVKAMLAGEQDPEAALRALGEITVDRLSPRQQIVRLRLEGRAYLELRRPKEAMPALERAMRLALQLGDATEVAHVRHQLGTSSYYAFAYREAMQHYLACLDALQRGEVRDAVLEFRVLSGLGNAHTALGEHAAAIGYYERALALSRDLVDQERLAGVHAGLAYAFTKQEDYEAALTHARSSLTLYEQIGAKRTLPEIMNNLAFLYGKVGNRARADELLEAAIDRARVSGNRFALPQILLSRAELFATTDPERASGLGREALAAAEAIEQREAILSARTFLAGLERDATRARASFDQCLALARAQVPDRERRVLESWSEWEEDHGDPRRAARLAREARKA